MMKMLYWLLENTCSICIGNNSEELKTNRMIAREEPIEGMNIPCQNGITESGSRPLPK